MAALALVACGGNPFVDDTTTDSGTDGGTTDGGTTDGTDGGTTGTDFSAATGDMRAFRFSGGVLEIDMQGVSSSGEFGEFVRRPAMDIASPGPGLPGLLAYEFQETALTRSYLAYVATNARNSIVATASADGGQFNERNGGGGWLRTDVYTRPTVPSGTTGTPGPETGTFSYIGSYAGVFVPGPAEAGNPRPPSLRPGEPWGVRGTIQINAQFEPTGSGNAEVVEGGISSRELFDRDGNVIPAILVDTTTIGDDEELLEDLVLRETTIDSTGQFLGTVEFEGSPNTGIGSYAGAFAGTAASDVAGILLINPIRNQNGIWEFGTFNLPRCDLAGAAPLCTPR
jgi:hypothetical protein